MTPTAVREPQVDVVLVGGGVAAVRCARTLRRRKFSGSILLIGDEPRAPYNRPPLSKEFLREDIPAELVNVEPDGWYRRQAVQLWTGVTVVDLDPARRRVSLSDGRSVRFEHCLIATGATPRRPPIPGGEDVLLLRSLADAERIRDRARPGRRAVLIGGGFLGVELAASLAGLGMVVTVLERSGALWGGALGAELAAWARRRLERAGVRVLLETSATSVEPGAVTVGRERLESDLVVAAVGVTPNVELATGAGLALDDGIVVDAAFRASAERVHAAGDVAAVPHPVAGGRRLRVEHWHAAREGGQAAAMAILGQPVPPPRPPWFFSEIAGASLDVVGWALPGSEVRRVGAEDRFALASLDGRRVTQLAIVNAHLPVEAARDLVATAQPVDRLATLQRPPRE